MHAAYRPLVKSDFESHQFYIEMAYESDLRNTAGMVLGVWNFIRRVGRWLNDFGDLHGGSGISER